MSRAKPVRYQGKIKSWKDDQGFGFIAPNGGGPLVFVHIKSFASRAIRPAVNDAVTFESGVNEKGQPRAANVAFVGGRVSPSPSPATGARPIIAALGFLGLVGIFVLVGKIPAVLFGGYLVMSALTLLAYAFDKSAARNNRWRTQESTLHMLALAGGWPGALLAQRLFRHKSKKQAFRSAFWFTVAVNCAVFGWLLSAPGANFLLAVFGFHDLRGS